MPLTQRCFQDKPGVGVGVGRFLMSDIRVCATDKGRFFTSKNPEQAPIIEVLLQNRIFNVLLQNRIIFDDLVSNVKNASCLPEK